MTITWKIRVSQKKLSNIPKNVEREKKGQLPNILKSSFDFTGRQHTIQFYFFGAFLFAFKFLINYFYLMFIEPNELVILWVENWIGNFMNWMKIHTLNDVRFIYLHKRNFLIEFLFHFNLFIGISIKEAFN